MPGRQRAEHEIFQPGFGRAHGIAVDGGDHVERQAHQLEAEIERDQVGRRDEHHHAGGREQDQDRIFEPLLALALEIVERHQDRGGGADERQKLEEARELLDHEAAAEGFEPLGRQPDDQRAGRRPAAASTSQLTERGGALAAEDADISSAMAPTASTISGRAGSSCRELGGFDHRRLTAPAWRRSWPRPAPRWYCAISCSTEAADRSSTGFGNTPNRMVSAASGPSVMTSR